MCVLRGDVVHANTRRDVGKFSRGATRVHGWLIQVVVERYRTYTKLDSIHNRTVQEITILPRHYFIPTQAFKGGADSL